MKSRAKNLLKAIYEWVICLLFKRTILVLTLLICLGVVVVLNSMSRLSSSLIQENAVQNATLYAQTIREARTLYSSDVIDKIKNIPGIKVSHEEDGLEGTIPLPTTYLMHLGQRIIDQNPNMSVRLYSDYPFPWREAEGGAKDKFEEDALLQLKLNPSQPFMRTEEFQGRLAFRYAEADLIKPSCVECHNTHPNSPKRDWQVGDVRGILEITQPIDEYAKQARERLEGTFIMLGGLSFLSLFGLSIVMGRIRRVNTELELRVHERTNDLVKTNHELNQSNKLVRQVFGRYLTNEIVAQLLETPEGLKLGGERRKVTILTSDLRGFTTLSEHLSPEEVVKILNIYLDYMADAIAQYQGTIDEFLGDGILVLFGAPTLREDDTERAVACAIAMQLAMGEVNEKMLEEGLPQLAMGIGINTGDVVVGNIGSEKRAKYGVIGNEVNLAYRIESYTTAEQVFISEQTFQAVGNTLKIHKQQYIRPKGIKKAITVYEVRGIAGEYNLYLPEKTEVFQTLQRPIYLDYYFIEGKHVQKTSFQGWLVQLSPCGGVITCNCQSIYKEKSDSGIPANFSNIKINLLDFQEIDKTQDIYAKVIHKDTVQSTSFYIHFTFIPQEVEASLKKIHSSRYLA